MILKALFKTSYYTTERKIQLLDATLGDDKIELAENCRLTCLASLPDPEVKERTWQELVDPKCKESPFVKAAKIEGFYAQSQLDIVRPYFD